MGKGKRGMAGAMAALLAAVAALASSGNVYAVSPDHHEFEATLEAPWRGERGEEREFVLHFSYPDASGPATVAWRLELAAADGLPLRSWHGELPFYGKPIEVRVAWDGLDAQRRVLADGHYQASLVATTGEPLLTRTVQGSLEQRVDQVLARDGLPRIEQSWDIEVGAPQRPVMPVFKALPTAADGGADKSAAATGGLPYTVYFGNLHSQTNDSDGGGAIGSCTSSQAAQSGAYGPAAAFPYARGRGLDFLMTSEHNHYFDGSSSTNTSASPTTARNRYAAGRAAASSFNTANPGFLALYGMEWGVISGGGHLNIVNANLLASWEYNSSNQLLGDLLTVKSDYAALYTTMRSRGWIGQFNHPDTSDQFPVGGTVMGYHADGDEVMVAAEILNTSAFSSNTSETETSRSTYEGAFNKLLERGFHIAPASNQDNHCANWGASYTNRTGVLLPNGTALNEASFVAALKARRVFATMDKNSQLILTANGRVMGERFNNSGSLNLVANFANSAGRSAAQVRIYEGVPGRNGTVTQLSASASATVTPSTGAHFYYAKVTQDDGKILWSAPIWVSQGAGGGDTTPPSVSAAASGSSGTINFSATATDNVGVARVEFHVDGSLRGSDSSSPYALAFDSTTLANGSHSLVARAFDAAGNSASSSTVNFSVSNGSGGTPVERIVNGGFESGSGSWTATSGVITNDSGAAAHGGSWKAWLNGYGSAHTDTVYQTVAIPAAATQATLSFWLDVTTSETSTTQAWDTLTVELRNSSNAVVATLATYSNLNAPGGYTQKTFDLLAYKGQSLRVYFKGVEGSQVATSFIVDDVSLITR
jgi:Bacterial Ig domain